MSPSRATSGLARASTSAAFTISSSHVTAIRSFLLFLDCDSSHSARGSPFYGATVEDLVKAAVTLTVSLTGIDEVFSQTVYARYVYNATDIIWGARFADIIDETSETGAHIDYTKFDQVEPAERPSGGLRRSA